jgi:syntaxin 5
MCDRTQEFQRLVHEATLVDANGIKKPRTIHPLKGKSAFNDAAADIARGVHKTSTMLSKLANLVRKQGLFDDPTEEINNLIFRIKEDLDELNTKCDTAQQFIDSSKGFFSAETKNQASQHNSKVVGQLKSELMSATKDFKTVLELRSSKMKDQQQRKLELTGKGLLSPISVSSSSASANSYPQVSSHLGLSHRHGSTVAPKALPSPYIDNAATPLLSTNGPMEESGGNSGYVYDASQSQQQLLLEPITANSQYYDAREKAVSEVEKTIGELGMLFKRLATMISEQQELIERIDDDVENAVENTNNARNALLKAYESVSSNRGMYLKIGAILAVFLLLFVLFVL